MVTIPLDELERLKDKNRSQANVITDLKEVLERKNRDLDALHFVWCTGGCPGGVHRFDRDAILTEDVVLSAERNTTRLRKWYNSVKWKTEHYPTMDEWHQERAKRLSKKIGLTDR